MGSKKPAREIFDITIDKLNVKPEEVVFIDDGANNIKKAREYGLNGILFESVEQLQSELAKLGLEV